MDWYEALKEALRGYFHHITFNDETKQVFLRGKEIHSPEVTFNNLIFADENELSIAGLMIANISNSLNV